MSLRYLCCLFFCGVVLWLNLTTIEVNAKERQYKKGEAIYLENCESCHMMGKNVIKPGKDIVVSTKILTLEEFQNFLTKEHGIMPAFPNLAKDKKLSVPLYRFVKTLKNQEWEYYPPLDSKEKSPGEEQGKNQKKVPESSLK